MVAGDEYDVEKGDWRGLAATRRAGPDCDYAVALNSDERVASAKVFGGADGPKGLEACPIVTDVCVGACIKDETVV